jgi:pimeloyl-ACP methyl ester carboxylesterase
MEACLRHPHELVRVAAAAAYHDRSSEPENLTAILEQGTRSVDLLIRQLAATALAQVTPDNARLRDLQRSSGRVAGAAGAGSHTAMIVHGTWALGATWWQPGGDFHSHVLHELRPDLYNGDKRFAWSGGYSDAARALGADDLLTWVNTHNEQGLDLFTHSHGGSLAMLASNRGLQIGELVLLSCPVHIPKYQPDFSRVQKVVSIRVHLDLIILADRGGQRFNHPNIEENVLPIWFDHTATHSPDVWKNNTYQIPAML